MPQQSFSGQTVGSAEQPQVPMCRTCGNIPLGQDHTCFGKIMTDDMTELRVQKQFMGKNVKTIVLLVDGRYAYRDGRLVDNIGDLKAVVPEQYLEAAIEQVQGPAPIPEPEVEDVEEEALPPLGKKDELEAKDYYDLQGIARGLGIKANQKKAVLVQAILDVQEYGYTLPEEEDEEE